MEAEGIGVARSKVWYLKTGSGLAAIDGSLGSMVNEVSGLLEDVFLDLG